jgi:hypothetical protein
MGQVYDIDFLYNAGWVQVLISQPPGANLVAISRDPQMLALLAAAYVDRSQIHVGLRPLPPGPPEIVVAHVFPNQPPVNPPPGEWAVESVLYDLGLQRTQAQFHGGGGPQQGFDDTGRVLPVLEAAIAARELVEYLTIDPAGRITRVKVNH